MLVKLRSCPTEEERAVIDVIDRAYNLPHRRCHWLVRPRERAFARDSGETAGRGVGAGVATGEGAGEVTTGGASFVGGLTCRNRACAAAKSSSRRPAISMRCSSSTINASGTIRSRT